MLGVVYTLYRWISKQLGDDLTEADIDDMIADVMLPLANFIEYTDHCWAWCTGGY